MRFTTAALTVVPFLFVSYSVQAGDVPPTQDYSGTWDLQALIDVPPMDGIECEFEGVAQVAQTGVELSGQASLGLLMGPDPCPLEMTAELSGTVMGDSVEMGALMGGPLGEGTFMGGMGNFPGTLQGSFAATTGPFVGSSGIWTAMRRESILVIPTLSDWGLVVMAVLLFLLATFFMLRRRRLEGNG